MSSTVKIFYVHLLCVDCWIPIKWRIKADFQRARGKNFQLFEASDPIISCSQVNWFLWNAFFCKLDRSGLIPSQVTVTGSFLKNGFHPTMKSNTTFPVLQNIGFDWFSFYCKYLSGKDQIIYWRSKGKLEKLLKPKSLSWRVFTKKHLKRLNSAISTRNHITFFLCLSTFFAGKARKSLDNYFNQKLIIGWILGNHFNVNLR